jgi:hypothetical protein
MRKLTITKPDENPSFLCMFRMRDKDGSEGYSEVRAFETLPECRRYAAFMGVEPKNIRIR